MKAARCRRRARPFPLVAGVVLALALSGCGGSKNAAVKRYAQQVNAVTSGMRLDLEQVAAANVAFRSKANLAELAPKLALAERSLATFAARLAALRPPPAAKQVAATLARLVALERALVAELHDFAIFLPAFREALVPYRKAIVAFQRAARTVKTATAEAVVVDTYARALSPPLAALARLSPPAVLEPTYAAEVRVLRSSRATALSLAAALRARQTGRAHALLVQLSRDAVSGGSLAAQRAQIAAVQAYDAKVQNVTNLENRAQLELARLQR